jgi:hypothetical protein
VHKYWEIGWTHGYNNSLKSKKNKTPANDINEMEKDLHNGQRWDPRKGPQSPDKTAKPITAKKFAKDAGKMFDKAFKDDVDENFINMAPQAVAEEGEFAGNFKTGPAGQWRNKGPKANKPAKVGDLVGASESKEIDPELARIMEMARFKR